MAFRLGAGVSLSQCKKRQPKAAGWEVAHMIALEKKFNISKSSTGFGIGADAFPDDTPDD